MAQTTKRKVCPHAHGEYSDDYRRCLDCGRDWVRIGMDWFEVEAWVRVSTKLLGEAEGSPVNGAT